MWFGNLPTSTELQGFHYYKGKRNTRCSYSFSSHTKNTTTPKNPNNQIAFSTQNGPKKFSWGRCPQTPRRCCPRTPRRLVHKRSGLGLSKSPIKNHAILFGLGRVIKPDQTKVDSTNPNIQQPNCMKL